MLHPDMTHFDRLERRWGWLAFPGFLRYYALFHILVYVLNYFRPDLAEVLEFDRAKILSGEVWRVVTMFFANSQFGRPSPLTLIFLFFVVNFIFMIGDGLESAWGVFKASLFHYTGIVLVLIANFVYPVAIPASGMMLYSSAFLAFATLFPMVEVRLMLILPIQVRFLGMFAGGLLLLNVISNPILLPFMVVALTNYFVWAALPALRGRAKVLESVQRKKKFKSAKGSDSEAFHTCVVCERTDVSDPSLEFRIGTDGKEYCTEHLPE